jgi:hypothetical protein
MPKYGKYLWQIVQEAAQILDKTIFAPKDVIKQVHINYPEIPKTTIRPFVIAMAPDHPSSYYYPSTRRKHPFFNYHGSGKYSLGYIVPPEGLPIKPDKKPPRKPKSKLSSKPRNKRENFDNNYRKIIHTWTNEHVKELIQARKTYTWENKPTIDCIRDRNDIQTTIVESRIRNGGGIDLDALNKVMKWGGMRNIKLTNDEALQITKESFDLLDNNDLKNAALKLLSIKGVGIASASKIIGLYDQNKYVIYDSRVGTALKSLTINEESLIKSPPGRNRPGDVCTYEKWVGDYERLIWTLEFMSEYLNEKGYPFNISDVEMALFMMGK